MRVAIQWAIMAAVVWLPANIPLYADVIYLKDGTKIETPKAWEENGVVNFYLKDASNIVVSYSSDIVDRIISGNGEEASVQPSSEDTAEGVDDEAEEPGKERQTAGNEDKADTTSPTVDRKDSSDIQPDPAKPALTAPTISDGTQPPPAVSTPTQTPAATPYDGIAFYDPRREFKYWSSDRSRHNTLKAAIGALAIEFNRSPEWVEQHMGDTNDLGQIYRNLSNPRSPTPESPAASQNKADGILFYNPRRPYKYWTSQSGKFNTFNEAIQALSKQFNAPPEWIKENMGDTNDLGEIHKNLMESKIRESGGEEALKE